MGNQERNLAIRLELDRRRFCCCLDPPLAVLASGADAAASYGAHLGCGLLARVVASGLAGLPGPVDSRRYPLDTSDHLAVSCRVHLCWHPGRTVGLGWWNSHGEDACEQGACDNPLMGYSCSYNFRRGHTCGCEPHFVRC